jgi:hypothetical protein
MQCLLKKQAAGGHLGKKKKVLGVQSHFFWNKRHPKRQNYSARQYYSVFFNVAFFVQKKSDQSITSVPKLISSIEKMWREIDDNLCTQKTQIEFIIFYYVKEKKDFHHYYINKVVSISTSGRNLQCTLWSSWACCAPGGGRGRCQSPPTSSRWMRWAWAQRWLWSLFSFVFMMDHKFSIRFKSGEFPGQSITVKGCWESKAETLCALWQGAPATSKCTVQGYQLRQNFSAPKQCVQCKNEQNIQKLYNFDIFKIIIL